MSGLERALILLQQRRFDLAEKELRRALSDDPHSGYMHAVLALTLLHDETRWQEATEEAQQAIALEPDEAFSHFALSRILAVRNHLPEALASINEAIRLDPYDAEYFAQRASVHIDRRDWTQALDDAVTGLSIDAESVHCNNLRTIALERLGRGHEAKEAAAQTLRRSPDDPNSHAAMGWTQLNTGDYAGAQLSFREALRLDPNHEPARDGMITALHGRSFVFRAIHQFYVAIGRLSVKYQFVIMFGAWILMQGLGSLGNQIPIIRPLTLPILMAYMIFVVLSWTSEPLFNTFLRFHPFGRHLLRRKEVWASNLLAVCGISAFAGSFGSLFVGGLLAALCVMFYWILMMVPVSIVFSAPTRQRTMLAVAAAVVVGLLPVYGVIAAFMTGDTDQIRLSLNRFNWGIIAMQIGSSFLAVAPVRR
ncbi:MAG: tetratricopeptide repeat protein [Pirellulales bacterium]